MKYQKNYPKFMKSKIFFLIFSLLILILLLKTNFIKNLVNLIEYDESQRIEKVYGFCDGESIGYLKYLKKKYVIKTNPKILNYVHTPKVNWSIYETSEKEDDQNQIIILNYPGNMIDIQLKYYKDGYYELIDQGYYSKLFETIEEIKIKDFKEPSINIEFYINNEINKLVIVKSLKVVKNEITNRYIMNQKFNAFEMSGKRFFIKFNKLKDKTKVFLSLKNKHDVNNYNILDKFKNCYFIE